MRKRILTEFLVCLVFLVYRPPRNLHFFEDGETEMLLGPSQRDVPGLDELIANLNDPSWGLALGCPAGCGVAGGTPNVIE